MRTNGLALEETSANDWQRMIDTNLSSVFYFGTPSRDA